MSVTVFIDTANIQQLATPRRWETEDETMQWGFETFTQTVMARIPREKQEEWMEEEIWL